VSVARHRATTLLARTPGPAVYAQHA